MMKQVLAVRVWTGGSKPCSSPEHLVVFLPKTFEMETLRHLKTVSTQITSDASWLDTKIKYWFLFSENYYFLRTSSQISDT